MRHVKLLIAFLVVSFYISALLVDRAAGVIFGVLLLLSLILLVSSRQSDSESFGGLVKQYWLLGLAMCGPLIAVFANQVGSNHFVARTYDSPFRLAMFSLIFWLFSFLPIKYMRYVQWGWVIGALLSAVKIYDLTYGGVIRYGDDFIPIIIFAEMALLLGMFATLSIAWDTHHDKLIILLKISALFAGLYAAYLSQSRGVWMTIPVFLFIAGLAAKNISFRYKFYLIIFFVAILGSISYFGNIVKTRMSGAENDISQYSMGENVDTSLGIRLQLWRGSWVLFKEHPVFGVGVENFPKALTELAERKIITPVSATFPHSHNEILFVMSRLGTFGLLAILGLYFIPVYYFFREIRHNDSEVRCTAAMGLSLCLGFFTLGLVDVVFLWWEIFPYYVISIAFFLSYIIKRKKEVTVSLS
ncbi:O-antigen ligase family protein [Collimonas sp. NPDC087041]|uniref:O-antigen ligase family protein n=1 Tax=Collimonas sp. NPDC087041 TaxID=3363960 RepID=UPI003830B3A8